MENHNYFKIDWRFEHNPIVLEELLRLMRDTEMRRDFLVLSLHNYLHHLQMLDCSQEQFSKAFEDHILPLMERHCYQALDILESVAKIAALRRNVVLEKRCDSIIRYHKRKVHDHGKETLLHSLASTESEEDSIRPNTVNSADRKQHPSSFCTSGNLFPDDRIDFDEPYREVRHVYKPE